jgi:hypothetical protein
MSKIHRIFESHQAPATLPLPPSPWHYEGLVRIPEENWQVIELAARQIDDLLVQKFLNLLQLLADGKNISSDDNELESYIKLFQDLRIKIQNEKFLDSIGRSELIDDFYDEEYVRMLDSIIAILQEAKISQSLFKTWFD